MRLAIVGTHKFATKELSDRFESAVKEYVRRLPRDVIIISGGATGVDSWAEQEAKRRGLSTQTYPAEWKKYGKSAGPLRNKLIVQNSDALIAWHDGNSKGTLNTLNFCKSREYQVPYAVMTSAENCTWILEASEDPAAFFIREPGQ